MTKRTEMGMEYWATLAEGRDEPRQAKELRRAGKALDLLSELAGYLRKNYGADVLSEPQPTCWLRPKRCWRHEAQRTK